jgi:membrane protein
MKLDKLKGWLQAIYKALDRATGGVPSILIATMKSFGQVKAAQTAASLAYYALFSLFPLLVVMIVVASLFLQNQQAVQQILTEVEDAIPISHSLIEKNINSVIDLRQTAGIVGLVSLLWSSLSVFNMLAIGINAAWDKTRSRGFLQQRLVALAMVAGISVLLLLLPIATSLLNFLPMLTMQAVSGTFLATPLGLIFQNLTPFIIYFLIMFVLYRWVPDAHVPWLAALWSSFVAAVLLLAANRGFAYYISSGLARYDVIYGSLGAIVALMFWIYLGSWIILFGAHLSAAIAERSARRKETSASDSSTASEKEK